MASVNTRTMPAGIVTNYSYDARPSTVAIVIATVTVVVVVIVIVVIAIAIVIVFTIHNK